MDAKELHFGDVVQFNPDTVENKAFAGCFGLVNEPKSWGAIVEILVPQNRNEPPGTAYYRTSFSEFELVGKAHFVPTR